MLCCYANCSVLSIVLLNVIMVNVIVSNVMAPLDSLPLDVTFPEPINLDFSRLKKTCLKVFHRFTAGFISFLFRFKCISKKHRVSDKKIQCLVGLMISRIRCFKNFTIVKYSCSMKSMQCMEAGTQCILQPMT